MIPLDHRHRATRPERTLQGLQRSLRIGQVLQDEADERMIEVARREREVEDVRTQEGHRVEARLQSPFAGQVQGSSETSIAVRRAPGLCCARMSVWAPTPQPISRTREPAG